MALAASIVWAVAQLYLLVLLARMVVQLVMAYSRGWRPRGAAAVAAEVVFTVTDPPIKLVRRLIPPVRLGAVSLDLAFIVVFLAVSAVAYVASAAML
jgi:YggT family protein